jgi:Fe-S cluster assembly protein SufD
MTLLAEGGDVAIEGLSWLKGNDHSHVHVVVDHKAPHCTSNQHIKMVLSDASRSSFTGKIVVQQIAQKTVSYQLNNNLLLSDSAQACSKPGLQILADDVKASHGATFCQLDEEQLFYLRSRGLTEEAARSLLLFGFCNEIIERVSLSSLQKTLREKIQTLSS